MKTYGKRDLVTGTRKGTEPRGRKAKARRDAKRGIAEIIDDEWQYVELVEAPCQMFSND